MISGMGSNLLKKLNPDISKDMGKVYFEMKFNESRGIEKSFIAKITYDKIEDKPLKMEFLRFEKEGDLGKAAICIHNCVQNIQVRLFIKYVPNGIKPFSLKIRLCPDCGAPIAYQFIVYLGDLKMYPKIKDLHKFKKNGIHTNRKLPRAIQSPEYRIGVINGCTK